jgi:hypothetical protein
MPIDYKDYPADWKEISLRIRKRAGNKCEQCGLHNGDVIVRYANGLSRGICGTERGWIREKIRNGYSYSGALKRLGFTKVVLTVAHLNHIKEDCRDENLKALCQRCHLTHDIKQHVLNRKYGRNRHKGNFTLKL